MLNRKPIAIFLLTFLTLNSCVVANQTKHKDDDGTHKADKTCKVHNVKMHKKIVGTEYGLVGYSNSGGGSLYPNAKRKAEMGCVQFMWPHHRLALIYVCSECTQLKKEAQ